MKAYADTSFIVKLVTVEADSEAAMAEFRRLDFPRLVYLPLHSLEVSNAIRQRAFHRRHSEKGVIRAQAERERDAALAKVQRWLTRGWLHDAIANYDEALQRAKLFSEKHTERLGCRGFDILHVALAVDLNCDVFLTADYNQGALARAESLNVITVAD